jgi:hypothetical protein
VREPSGISPGGACGRSLVHEQRSQPAERTRGGALAGRPQQARRAAAAKARCSPLLADVHLEESFCRQCC